MAFTNSRTAWGGIARFFHWSMAVLVIAMLIGGTIMVAWPDSELATKFALYQWHKSFGLLVAVLLVLRVGWRLAQPVPPLPPGTSAFTRRASAITHGLLYALLVLIPLSGYLMTSANTLGIPTLAFGLIPVPHLIAADAGLESAFKTTHELLTKLLMAVLAVHVLAALKHAIIQRDGIWTRMVRGEARRSGEPGQ